MCGPSLSPSLPPSLPPSLRSFVPFYLFPAFCPFILTFPHPSLSPFVFILCKQHLSTPWCLSLTLTPPPPSSLPPTLPPSLTVESVRRLLPSQFEDEDFQEQEQRSKQARREGGAEDAEEALPLGGREESIPAWFFTLVCFVVVVAFAVKK